MTNESKEFEEIIKQIKQEENDTDNPTMPTTPQHTPTPWKEVCGRWLVDGHLVYQLEEYHDERTGALRKRNRFWFSVNGQGQIDELAEQIALDLNTHAALVEALRDAAVRLETIAELARKAPMEIGQEIYNVAYSGSARRALAAAKGTK